MNTAKSDLRSEVEDALVAQGYVVNNGVYQPGDAFMFGKNVRANRRRLHQYARAERIREHIRFIRDFLPTAGEHIRDSKEINIEKIKPEIREVKTGTKNEKFFRWWNMVWWSLPFEKAYGRQMRFIVWDEHHNAPIGLIGLQSPILSWSVRDEHLGISADGRDFWVNQSLSAQRLGALPPYNGFLGGKLIVSLMTSDVIRDTYGKKYQNSITLMEKRQLPANLLFITTTAAYGKSSVYNRLRFHDEKICEFIGYTKGYGSFYIPNTLYESFLGCLKEKDFEVKRSYGDGPSVKMRNISQVMKLLGFKGGCKHGMQRAAYLFPLIENLQEHIHAGKRPVWFKRSVDKLTEYWQHRWAYKRNGKTPGIGKDTAKAIAEKIHFSRKKYLKELNKDLAQCEKLANKENF